MKSDTLKLNQAFSWFENSNEKCTNGGLNNKKKVLSYNYKCPIKSVSFDIGLYHLVIMVESARKLERSSVAADICTLWVILCMIMPLSVL